MLELYWIALEDDGRIYDWQILPEIHEKLDRAEGISLLIRLCIFFLFKEFFIKL